MKTERQVYHHGLALAFLSTLQLTNGQSRKTGNHWARTSASFELGVIKSIDDTTPLTDWEKSWDSALQGWSQSSKLNLVTVPGDSSPSSRKNCAPVDGYIRVCNWNYGPTVWAGLSEWAYTYDQVDKNTHPDGHLVWCAVKLNDRTVVPNDSAVKQILCHELGHCLGLDHTSIVLGEETGSCMGYSYAPSSIGPSQEDYNVLDQIYGHIDSQPTHQIPNTYDYTGGSTVSCPSRSNEVSCDSNPDCYWKGGSGGRCLTFQCSILTTDGECGADSRCKWMGGSGGHCVPSLSRRVLQDEECGIHRTQFDVPEDAYVVECNDASITFERREGGIGTKYQFIYTQEEETRRRALRGSS